MYEIQPYTYKKAMEVGVEVKPSTRKYKKLDVFYMGKYVASIGDNRYVDYPTLLRHDRKEANRRRHLYYQRHSKDNRIGGLLAMWLLW